MKPKMLTVCIIVFFTINFTYAQRDIIPWGVWGNGEVRNQNDLSEYSRHDLTGFNVNIKWSDIQPTKNRFDWAAIDNAMQFLMENDIWAGMMPVFGQNCPEWVYDDVPRVTTQGGNDDGPYPYYFDKDYQKYYFNVLKEIANHFAGFDKRTASFLVYWQITEGSTGDTGPYKGEPVNDQYAISDDDWQEFRHRVWDSIEVYTQGRTYKLLLNGGNDAEYLDYIHEHFPGDMNKDGNLSHDYSFDGETVYFTRQLPHIHDVLFNYRTRGEAQGFWKHPWWQDAPLKQSFTLITSALAGGLDMFNIPSGWINQNTRDVRPTNFFHDYGGFRTGRLSARGFIALRDAVDFVDTARFPVNRFGPIIDPERQQQFERNMNNIDNAYGEDQPTYAWWLKATTIANFINPARVNRIVEEFEPQGAMYNTKGDQYRKDFGVLLTKNYAKFILQLNPNETSIGRYRLGPDSSMYGRYAREFIINSDGGGRMAFKLSDSLFNTTGASGVRVRIRVTYFDAGNGKWTIAAGKNDENKFQVTNTNTNQWKQVDVEFDNFSTNSLPDEADFRLNYNSGDNTAFALIEFENLDKSEQLPSTRLRPSGATLKQNIPNPVTNNTSISYTIPKEVKNAQLVISNNSTGIVVKRIPLTATVGTVQVDATLFKNGIYSYALVMNGKTVEAKKMVIMR